MAELFNKNVLWYKSKMQAFSGRMVVTETRFTFYQAPKWAMLFGALGALIAAGAKGKALVDDDIQNLQFAKGRKIGKKGYMLNVTTQGGQSYDFLFDDKFYEKVSSVITLADAVEA